MARLVALMNVPYGNAQYAKGQEFEATEGEARVLVALKRARLAGDEVPVTVKKPKAKVMTTESVKRTYRRRDMKAEPE